MTSMVKTLNDAIAAVSQDTEQIQQAYQQLRKDNLARDKALADLTAMVKEYGTSPAATRPYGPPTPKMQTDVLDEDGNLRAADIGITWADNETFLHGVRVVGTIIPRPAGHEPVMSTPYSEERNDDGGPSSITGRPSSPETIEFGPEIITANCPAAEHLHRPAVDVGQGYRPAAPIQRFNNKSLNWPAWFRHFRAVADVHGWSKEQRALQLMSYLDETAMNVAQELGDNNLYNYDVLIKLLGERFDPASRVSASRSRFHARSRRHHDDADAFADALAELCRVGYPQSPPELRQELIAEQFVRGQSDPELKKYLWVVIRTQKERKLQTLIEVCTDFASLVSPTHLHRPAEQTFAVHQQSNSYIQKRSRIKMTSSLWATVHLGIEELRIHPHLLAYKRCSHWHVVWDMKCAQLPDNRMLSVDLRETIPLLTRIGDFVPQHGPAEITHKLSVSAAVNLAICRVVARDRTLPCRLNQQDGTSNPTTGLLGTAITTVRETLNRSGHHPHRSIRTSSGPTVIFSCHVDLITSNEGNLYYNYSFTIEHMYRNMYIPNGSGGRGTTGDAPTRYKSRPVSQ